jgi:hypothetical protein
MRAAGNPCGPCMTAGSHLTRHCATGITAHNVAPPQASTGIGDAGPTMHSPLMYSRRDIAVMGYAAGLLTGLVVAFAACSPPTTVLDSDGRCIENCR